MKPETGAPADRGASPGAGGVLDTPEVLPAPDRILRLRTVLGWTGLSRSTLYRKIAEGTFPKAIAISTRCVGWRESAVQRWLREPGALSADGRSSSTPPHSACGRRAS